MVKPLKTCQNRVTTLVRNLLGDKRCRLQIDLRNVVPHSTLLFTTTWRNSVALGGAFDCVDVSFMILPGHEVAAYNRVYVARIPDLSGRQLDRRSVHLRRL